MHTLDIKVLRLHDDVTLPAYATPGSMCFDLHLFSPATPQTIRPGQRVLVHTGLAFGLPHGWGMDVFSRSGHGHALGVSLANGTGKIDQDYTGELRLCLANHGAKVVVFNHGDRIAQAEPRPIVRANFVCAQALDTTLRGAGGFGSTGT